MTGLRYLDRTLMRLAMEYKLCLSEKAFDVELTALGVPLENRPSFMLHSHSAATTHFVEITGGSGGLVALVCINPAGLPFSSVVGYLAHEAVHIWQEHCALIGERGAGSETQAYAMQTLVESLVEEYQRQVGTL